jgi:hypothetical protein
VAGRVGEFCGFQLLITAVLRILPIVPEPRIFYRLCKRREGTDKRVGTTSARPSGSREIPGGLSFAAGRFAGPQDRDRKHVENIGDGEMRTADGPLPGQ